MFLNPNNCDHSLFSNRKELNAIIMVITLITLGVTSVDYHPPPDSTKFITMLPFVYVYLTLIVGLLKIKNMFAFPLLSNWNLQTSEICKENVWQDEFWLWKLKLEVQYHSNHFWRRTFKCWLMQMIKINSHNEIEFKDKTLFRAEKLFKSSEIVK